ncbi:right-handed parallel beta-helix repeat-containing protein [Coraliomargarita sp. W4R53]
MRGIEVGDRYQEQARKNGTSIFFMGESKQISYDSITIFAAPAGNFVGSYNEAINILNCEIAIKAGRWKSSNADAVHLQSNRIGPWIENSRFEGAMDDLVNLYTVPFNVTEIITPTKLLLGKSSNRGQTTQLFDGRGYQHGDTLVFFNPNTGAILGEREILSIDGKLGTVMFDSPVSNIQIGSTKKDTHVYNKNLSGNFVIRGNQFLNSRRYGLLIKGSNGLIQNNHFEGLFEQAITLHNLPDWPEGLFSEDITIDGNSFKLCGFSGPYLSRLSRIGVVDVWASRLEYQAVAEHKTHRNLRITNNQWSEWEGNALYIANTDGALVTGNKFIPDSKLADLASHITVDAASCANLTIED